MNRSNDYADGYLDGYARALADTRRAAFAQSSHLPGPWLRAVDVLITRLEEGNRRRFLAVVSKRNGGAS